MLNKAHSFVVALELLVLGVLGLTRQIHLLTDLVQPLFAAMNRPGLTPLLAGNDAQKDCYQFLSFFLLELAIYHVVMAEDIDFVMSTLVARAILIFLITPEMILTNSGVTADAWLLVLLEGIQVVALYVSMTDAMKRGVKTYRPFPNFPQHPAWVAGAPLALLGASLVLRQGWYAIRPLDYVVMQPLGLEPLGSLLLQPTVVPMAAICAQPLAQLGFLFFWNDQSPKLGKISVFCRVALSGLGLVLTVFVCENLPDGLYLLSLWSFIGALVTFLAMSKRPTHSPEHTQ